jgi:hypothetical protein
MKWITQIIRLNAGFYVTHSTIVFTHKMYMILLKLVFIIGFLTGLTLGYLFKSYGLNFKERVVLNNSLRKTYSNRKNSPVG